MSQATISRFETGKRVPTENDIRVLGEVYGATPEILQELLRIAQDLRAGAISTRAVLHHHGAPSMQSRIGRIEASSARIRSFHPAIVIGLLQTHDYARALLSGRFTGRELDAMVAARLARQQILDTDREFHFVLTEGALRWHVGSPQIMAGQAAHLAELVKLPNLRLGIIPWTRPTNRPILHPFQIYDERAVMLSTETSVALITDARDVTDFATRFDIYAGFADYGGAATSVFRRIADEYRELVKDSH
jgi:transcriptional regulator with XRE-family HTH domain